MVPCPEFFSSPPPSADWPFRLLQSGFQSIRKGVGLGKNFGFSPAPTLRKIPEQEAAFCHLERVGNWREFPHSGVQRGLKHRKGWKERWYQTVESPLPHPQLEALQPVALPESLAHRLHAPPLPAEIREKPEAFQPGGETAAWRYLRGFIEGRRINGYSRLISKPAASRRACSRLSPYLAWVNLSIQQVWQYTQAFQDAGHRRRDL